MSRLCAFIILGAVLPIGFTMLVACGSEGTMLSPSPGPDSSLPEASPSPPADAGTPEPDAAKPKPDYDASDEPVACATTPCATELVAGEEHFCVLLSTGDVRCWGTNEKGQLGSGDVDAGVGPGPARVVSLSNVTQLSAGGRTTCARTAEGVVQCWGSNEKGELGLSADFGNVDDTPHPTPAPIAFAGSLTRVDVGHGTACALASAPDTGVVCWGDNGRRQLARADDSPAGGPALADMRGFSVTRVGLGESLKGWIPWEPPGEATGFGLTSDKKLVSWADASGRQSSMTPSPIPAEIPNLDGIVNIAVAPTHVCVVARGDVYCWGTNKKGAYCTGLPGTEASPVRVPLIGAEGAFPQRVAAAANTSCVRMTDGTLQCCGDDRLGQLGRGKPGLLEPLLVPVSALEERAVSVATSSLTTCALLQGGKVACWGGNANGELGQGTRDEDPHPTPVTVSFE